MNREIVELSVFALGQIIVLAATIATLKSDTKMLKDQMKGVSAELAKIGEILITLANIGGRLNLVDERMLAQGKRVDEVEKKNNRLLEFIIKVKTNRDTEGMMD